jgi:pyridoxamine 5'-phosphate oxidase
VTDAYSDIRDDYDTAEMEPDHLDDDPVAEVRRWLDRAIGAGAPQANTASLATVGADGRPSVRSVLLKGIDHGFVFYTNYRSRKADQIERNPAVALSLTWVALHQQIRIEGTARRVERALSDAYFASRPRGAQIAARASRQSAELSDRAALEERFAAEEAAWPAVVDRPEDWGGFRIIADRIEFWQGRRDRMHDRIEYLAHGEEWRRRRLSP